MKERVIIIHEQEFRYGHNEDYSAWKKVKELMDCGLWHIDLKEEIVIKDKEENKDKIKNKK